MTKDGIPVIRSHLSGRPWRSAEQLPAPISARTIVPFTGPGGLRCTGRGVRHQACWSCGFVRLRGELPGII
ncbi:hypothetical protein GCM10022379_33610 [Micromonospora maritima]